MRYAFVERHKRVWPIRVQCRVLRVSVSGYHQHVRRRKQITQRRHLSDAALLVHIRAVFAAHRGAYGWPRVWRHLLGQDVRVGKSRVQRLMQLYNIRARGKRRFRIATTDSRHGLPIAPNLLDRNFAPAGPNRAWAGDVTYIPTEEGWLFLAVVMDLFSRRIVGWSMRDNMRSEIVIDALEMAWFQRSPDKKRGADLPQRLRQSVPGSPRTRLRPWGRVCQPRVQTGAQRAPNHTLHEPQGQMLG